MNHYIIGDVHGEYDMLMRLVSKIPCEAKLIFVGDFVDRGSRSVEVIRFVNVNIGCLVCIVYRRGGSE